MQDDKRTQRYRTSDVQSDACSFNDLLLPAPLVNALTAAGLVRPSPVQNAAIPIGRVGTDLIVQAKSGTGKTAVFAVILLEKVSVDVPTPQGLVVAPTRELAIQSYQVIQRVVAGLPDPAPSTAVFVGGLPTADDEKRLRRTCHIVVGTPGRVCALVTSGALLVGRIKCFVMDEADQLMSDSFQADVAWLMQQLPNRKQVLAFSATYTPELLGNLEAVMRRPQKVLLCEETVSLLGIRQYYKCIGYQDTNTTTACTGGSSSHSCSTVATAESALHLQSMGSVDAAVPGVAAASQHTLPPADSSTVGDDQVAEQQQPASTDLQQLLVSKVEALLHLLSTVSFHQAVVFCNKKPAAEWLARRLTAAGCPATYLSADLSQTQRMAAMETVIGFKVRVIVSTDVMARGVDFDRVNLVVNLDLPPDAATYVHRVGRTGRFGSRGVAVALVTEAELKTLHGFLEGVRGGDVLPLPAVIPDDLYTFDLGSDWEREALQHLLAAPTTTPPHSPPPVTKQRNQAAATATDYADKTDAAAAVQDTNLQDNSENEQHGSSRATDAAAEAGGVSEADAWDAWAGYYRSCGYRYPYENPYRHPATAIAIATGTGGVQQQQQEQQQAVDFGTVSNPFYAGQQYNPWQRNSWSSSSHYHCNKSLQPAGPFSTSAPYYRQQPCLSALDQPGQHAQMHKQLAAADVGGSRQLSKVAAFNATSKQQPPVAAQAAAAADGFGMPQLSSDVTGPEQHDCWSDENDPQVDLLPDNDAECDPRALLLLSRLEVADKAKAAEDPAASSNSNAGVGSDEDSSPAASGLSRGQNSTQGANKKGKSSQYQPQQQWEQQPQHQHQQAHSSWHHAYSSGHQQLFYAQPGCKAIPSMGQTYGALSHVPLLPPGGRLCEGCWVAAYAAWHREYEAWREHYRWWYTQGYSQGQ